MRFFASLALAGAASAAVIPNVGNLQGTATGVVSSAEGAASGAVQGVEGAVSGVEGAATGLLAPLSQTVEGTAGPLLSEVEGSVGNVAPVKRTFGNQLEYPVEEVPNEVTSLTGAGGVSSMPMYILLSN